MTDDKPATTMEIRYKLGPDGVPFLLLDGVPVPEGATVTMPASAVAAFGYGCAQLGARAGMAGRPATLGDLAALAGTVAATTTAATAATVGAIDRQSAVLAAPVARVVRQRDAAGRIVSTVEEPLL